jgi:hypothetical protein
VDEEYPEWVDMLYSVSRVQDDYVIAEFGARYGTWGARGLAAWNQLRPGKNGTYIGVRPALVDLIFTRLRALVSTLNG